MWRLFLVCILALTAISWGQVSSEPVPSDAHASEPQAPASPGQNAAAASDAPAPGSLLAAELSKSLDAKKCKVNDKVEAKTVINASVGSQSNIPRNTIVIGHVTEVKVHSKASPGATVAISFDRLLLKGGRGVPVPMTVQAVARPVHVVPDQSGPDNIAGRTMAPDRMETVGSQAPAAGSSSLPSPYPSNIPSPPSTNTGWPANATVPPLDSASRGVVGIKDLTLDTSGPWTVLSSGTGNVHLDSRAQLLLRVQ